MVTESTFVGCSNMPPEMAAKLDKPWHFAGEINPKHTGTLAVICKKCSSDSWHYCATTVRCESYKFVTDDMIVVRVYFGVCADCDSVYWARQGPPFTRARQCVHA